METNHAYINYLKGDSKIEENLNYYEERAKLTKAKRLNEELDLRLKKQELHESEVIERVMGEMLTNFKVRLLAIPAKLSPALAAEKDKTKIYKLLEDAVEEALNELSDFETAFSIDPLPEKTEKGGGNWKEKETKKK